jgi:hypothetical protein
MILAPEPDFASFGNVTELDSASSGIILSLDSALTSFGFVLVLELDPAPFATDLSLLQLNKSEKRNPSIFVEPSQELTFSCQLLSPSPAPLHHSRIKDSPALLATTTGNSCPDTSRS